MTTRKTSSARFRTSLGLGLAFVIGVLTFFITLQIIDRFRPPSGEQLEPPDKRPVAGMLAFPTLSADTSGSGPLWSLQDQKGKVVIVNYFATWCGPCIAEMPDLVSLSEEYASQGVTMVAVSMDHDNETKEGVTRLESLRAFKERHKVPIPILLPDETSVLMRSSFPIPQTFIYDRQGRRARLILGPIDKDSVKRTLDQLLKEG